MSGFDAAEHRAASLQNWEAAAAGWSRRGALVRDWLAPVSHWMVEAIAPQPGERVLELAAGLGETGMLAAELVVPGGTVVISDQAETMLAAARVSARELGVSNVEFEVLNAEWIDLPLASVDAVLCRFGYMLMTDPDAALGETRRVLRPGSGRLALAVWSDVTENLWAYLPALELRERGVPTSADGVPGPFSMPTERVVRQRLQAAGFVVERIEAIDLVRRHRSFEEAWEVQLDLSRSFHDAVMSLPGPEIADVKTSLERRFSDAVPSWGRLEIPGRALVALAAA